MNRITSLQKKRNFLFLAEVLAQTVCLEVSKTASPKQRNTTCNQIPIKSPDTITRQTQFLRVIFSVAQIFLDGK